jgi:RND superfamily putative drug exporter
LLLIVSGFYAPSWQSFAQDSDIAFLPQNAPSRRGDRLFQNAFPDQYAGTDIVLVLSRQGGKLRDEDDVFIEQTLTPALNNMSKGEKDRASLVKRIRTPADGTAGALLVSQDKQAALVVVDLDLTFLDSRGWPWVSHVEDLVQRLSQAGQVPPGLTINVTGSATAGRDLTRAESQSVRAIEVWTIIAVITLLILLYRAPLVALIPLATVYVAVQISINLLAIMGSADIIRLSEDVRIFITVLAYGAGVDYCVFLIARYREETLRGIEMRDALIHSIARVGLSITASAATVICGIGVLAFMQFGKVREAGLVIPFTLIIVLAGTLTFTTALLRMSGRWAFWPHRPPGRREPKTLAPSLLHRLLGFNVWQKLGSMLLRRPGLIWLATVAVMVAFALVAVLHYQDETYNPIADLPSDAPSVVGTKVVEKHFPLGVLGTYIVFLRNDQVDFSEIKGIEEIGQLTERLRQHRQELGLADIRSVATPVGITTAASEVENQATSSFARRVLRARAARYYTSRTDDWKGHLTRLDLVLVQDPFSPQAVDDVERIERAVRTYLPAGLQGSELVFAGATVSIRDLSEVKQGDLERVEMFVPIVIFLLLWIVLRRVAISIYLVLSVLLSYLSTIGATFVVFWLLYPGEFTGLDWKVPIFLFTILVAVGEDYNIFLMTRIREEQEAHGPLQGIILALTRTGRVISSCGFIMAGTFASLFSGSLLAMKELAFALSFGILLDTLVVRPILVPAFLILLEDRFGSVGRFLALHRHSKPAVQDASTTVSSAS